LFILLMLVYVCNVKWFTMVVDHYWNFDLQLDFCHVHVVTQNLPPFLNKLIVYTLHCLINLFCFMCTLCVCVWLAKFEHLLAYDVYECIQNNRNQGHFLGWLLRKQWVILLRWCDILQLVTKDNGWNIHDYSGQKY
jgi:hypothetical protein